MNKLLTLEVTKDAFLWLEIQKRGFKDLYDKYHDDDISPFTESIEKVLHRFLCKDVVHYLIKYNSEIAGGLRVKKLGFGCYKLGIIFVFPEYQNLSIGKQAVIMTESLFEDRKSFELETILQEDRNIYFYEKLGYKKIEIIKNINDDMDIVLYRKYF